VWVSCLAGAGRGLGGGCAGGVETLRCFNAVAVPFSSLRRLLGTGGQVLSRTLDFGFSAFVVFVVFVPWVHRRSKPDRRLDGLAIAAHYRAGALAVLTYVSGPCGLCRLPRAAADAPGVN